MQHGDGWLHDRLNAEDEARRLKTQFFEELAAYDPVQSALVGIFSDDTFRERFGTTVPALDDAGFAAIMRTTRKCAQTSPDFTALAKRNIFDRLFSQQMLAREWHDMHPPFSWRPLPEGTTISRSEALALRGQPVEARARLQDLVARAMAAPDKAQITAAFRGEPAVLNQVSPGDLAAALEPMRRPLEALQHETAKQQAAARRPLAWLAFPSLKRRSRPSGRN